MAGLPGFDPVLQARSGLMRAQGGEGQEPVYHQIAVSDFTAALLAAFGVIGALLVREQTGRGQLVETSLLAAAMAAQAAEFTRYAGRPPDVRGAPNLIGVSALRRSYQCADGWVFLAADGASQAEALLTSPAMALGAGSTRRLRAIRRRGDAARARARRFFAGLSREEAVRRLNAAACPALPARRSSTCSRTST